MRRRFVSEEDRDKIIQLRRSGGSWLGIEFMTGIPRRTAKSIYDEWQKNQAADEVISARRQVAAEAFKEHMHDLIVLAREITISLALPAFNDMRNGGQVLDNLFEKDICRSTSETSPFSFVKRDTTTTIRKNHILLDSLKQHTRGKVDWDLLDNWSVARDDWHFGRERLEAEVKQVRDKINQIDDTAASIFKQPKTSDRMAKGIVETAYYALIENDFRTPEKYIKVKELQDGWAIFFSGDTSDTELVSETADVADIVAAFCQKVVKELFAQDKPLLKGMATSLAKMQEAHEELMDKLDELRLTPVILQTKCDICPA